MTLVSGHGPDFYRRGITIMGKMDLVDYGCLDLMETISFVNHKTLSIACHVGMFIHSRFFDPFSCQTLT